MESRMFVCKRIRKKRGIAYVGTGSIGFGVFSGCGLFRRTSEKRMSSRAQRTDSVRTDATSRLESRTWTTADRCERLSWQEAVFSPPDSTGRQSIRRIRTATLDASQKTLSRDTATLRSAREQTELRHTLREEAQAECRQPAHGGFRGGIATGLFVVLLLAWLVCYLRRRKQR